MDQVALLTKSELLHRSSSKDSSRSSVSSDDFKPLSFRANDDFDLLDLPFDGTPAKRNSFILNDWEIIREALRHTDNVNALTKELEMTIRDVHQFLLGLENDHLILRRNDKLTPEQRKLLEDRLRDKILVTKDILHRLKLYNVLDKATSCDTGKFSDVEDARKKKGLCISLFSWTQAKGPKIRVKGVKGKGKSTPKPTKSMKSKPTRLTSPDCASISLFRYQHLVAMNYTTTTTEWPEVSRIKKRIERNDSRNSIIIDVLRTKFHLMTEKQQFKIDFGKFKRYILKIGGNGTRFLPQFMEIAEKNKMYAQRVTQIDVFLKRWGIPRYENIAHRFTYITPVYTPPLNYTPTEKWSKMMWFKTSVLDVRYQKVMHRIQNPVKWDDLNIHTTDAWIFALENMPGYKHHARKFNLGLKHQAKYNRTRLYLLKMAAMSKINYTGDWRNFTGTLIPTTTQFVLYDQPDVIGAVERYFNTSSVVNEGGPDDPWYRFHQNPKFHR